MKFSEHLRSYVAELGTNESARICGVTPRALQLWMKGDGEPNISQQAGALFLLGCPSHELPQSTLSLPSLENRPMTAGEIITRNKEGFEKMASEFQVAARKISAPLLAKVSKLCPPSFPSGDLAAARAGRQPVLGGLLKAQKK